MKSNSPGHIIPDCAGCEDNSAQVCPDCGCQVCGGKQSPDRQLVCDECDRATHFWCLRTPVAAVPKQDHWYCDRCRNQSQSELDQLRRNHLERKRKQPGGLWGAGMACVGRRRETDVKPVPVFGPLDSVPVGMWWRFRVQASEAGVHAPLVSGIHGREAVGAYSVVFAGGDSELDIDLGDDLYYTAAGGRVTGSRNRTGTRVVGDQQLRRENKALAMSCWAAFDDRQGASAGEQWRQGKPVRLLRNGNARRHRSKFLPRIGIRYDGIYKVVKYWPETGRWMRS